MPTDSIQAARRPFVGVWTLESFTEKTDSSEESIPYLAVFLMSHFSAVARARYLRHSDTNWTWLTSYNLLTDKWSARLTPYYFLGIVALSIHAACAVRFVLMAHGTKPSAANRIFGVLVGSGSIVAVAIMVGLVRGSIHM